jgi:aminodeoxyfutalosine deaminase
MAYRKFRAGKLFTGQQMLTGQVLVCREDGTIEDMVPAEQAGDAEPLEGILSPGFVNCHCHLELSHMKGMIPEGTGLVDFVYKVITERHFDKEVMLEAVMQAEDEMLANGIVAVGDICNNPVSLPQKLRKRMYYHNFIEASGFGPQVAEERMKRSTDLFNVFAELSDTPSASNSIVPHAPYSVSETLFRRIAAFPGNRLLAMHNQEDEHENALFKNKTGDFLRLYERMNIDHSFFVPTGKSSLQSTLQYFFPGQQLILVHNVATSEEDLQFLAQRPDIYFCLCPNANQYITGSMPPVERLLKHHAKLVLGTDSLASNHQLSILAEMSSLQKHFPQLTQTQLLQWATSNGAKALEIDSSYGSFEKDKKPGVILIDDDFKSVQRVL